MPCGLCMLHHPVEVAHRMARLEHLARGRVYWGSGGGAIPTELALFGLDPSRPSVDRR
jgi:limonene 1,2-monooxygenase